VPPRNRLSKVTLCVRAPHLPAFGNVERVFNVVCAAFVIYPVGKIAPITQIAFSA